MGALYSSHFQSLNLTKVKALLFVHRNPQPNVISDQAGTLNYSVMSYQGTIRFSFSLHSFLRRKKK